MGMFDNMKDKAADLAGQHSDKVEELSDQGLDRGEDLAGDRLGEGQADRIAQGREAVDERIGDRGDATDNPA